MQPVATATFSILNDDISPGNDILLGLAGDDFINALAGDDTISGRDGSDTFIGGQGNDVLNGDQGIDLSIYTSGTEAVAGMRRSFTISGDLINGGSVAGNNTVSAAAHGTDTISGMEILSFLDGRVVADVNSAAAQAYRMYDSTFDRAPDGPGFNYWISNLEGGTTVAAMAEYFAVSPEFQSTYGGLSNQGFVEQIYRNVLDREGETEGLNFWTGELNAGRFTRGQVLAGFSESIEHVDMLRSVVQAGLWDVDETAAQMARIYNAALNRLPDAVGLAFWTKSVKEGAFDPLGVASFFVASPELATKYGNLSNEAFVDQLYQNVLDRPGEREGVDFWTGVLDAGTMSRSDVLLGFSESEENKAKTQFWMDDGILFA